MTTYNVRPGDTLSAIAVKYDTTVSTLAKQNHIADPDVIHVGQKLQVDGFEPKTPKKNAKPKPAPTPTPTKGSTPTPAPKPAGPKNSAKPSKQVLPKGMPNTVNMPESKEYALYSKYVEKYGDDQAKKDLAAGKRVIVGLRQNTPFNGSEPYRGKYDDRIVVMWKDPNGTAHVQEFAGNTEPNQRWAQDPSQATKPVGRLVGNRTFHYKKGFSSSHGGTILTPDLRYGNPLERRDTNHNGRIDSGDQAYSGSWGGQYVYFHRGGFGDTYSAGCQTMDPSHFDGFWSALGSQSTFSYVLANVG